MTLVDDLFALTLPNLVVLVLGLGRVGGLFLVAPVLSSRVVPVRVRAALVFFFTIAMLPVLTGGAATAVSASAGPFVLCGWLLIEVGIGFTIGLVAQFIFGGVQMAGEIAGIQMGLGMAQLMDPQTLEQVTSLSQWLNLMALMVFLAIDGHHQLIRAIATSFTLLPVGDGFPAAAGLELVLMMASGMFVIALKIAAPVMVMLLLMNGAMGVLSKLIPQLNVFIVGFPLNIGAGLLMLAAALPFTIHLLGVSFGDLSTALAAVLRALG